MIKLAKEKFSDKPNLRFYDTKIEYFKPEFSYDYIFLADVVEHLDDVESMFVNVRNFMQPHTDLIITMANPIWEPVLMIAEKFKMKMPEGPHNRISTKELHNILTSLGYSNFEKKYKLLIPKSLGKLSDFINKHFSKVPILNKLGFIIVIKCQKHA